MKEEPPIYVTRPKELHRILGVSNSLAMAGIFILISSVIMVPADHLKPRVNIFGVPTPGPDGSLYEFDRVAQARQDWPVYFLFTCAAIFFIRALILCFRPAPPSAV